MAERGRCTWSQGGTRWWSADTPTIPFPTLSDQSQSEQIFRDVSRLFSLHPVVGFTFSPGQSCSVFAGEKDDIPRKAFATKQQAQLLEKLPTLCSHQRSQGPWLKPQISKKNVKPWELVILLSGNTHFKRISMLLPLKHVLVLFSTLNTWEYQ